MKLDASLLSNVSHSLYSLVSCTLSNYFNVVIKLCWILWKPVTFVLNWIVYVNAQWNDVFEQFFFRMSVHPKCFFRTFDVRVRNFGHFGIQNFGIWTDRPGPVRTGPDTHLTETVSGHSDMCLITISGRTLFLAHIRTGQTNILSEPAHQKTWKCLHFVSRCWRDSFQRRQVFLLADRVEKLTSVASNFAEMIFFLNSWVKVLVRTNLCSRALNVNRYLVVNFDSPFSIGKQFDPKVYTYRVSRTVCFCQHDVAITCVSITLNSGCDWENGSVSMRYHLS